MVTKYRLVELRNTENPEVPYWVIEESIRLWFGYSEWREAEDENIFNDYQTAVERINHLRRQPPKVFRKVLDV